jgi:hypothetical protein
MGFGIVDIWKTGENGSLVIYSFTHEGREGSFTIDARTGFTSDVVAVPGTAGYAAKHKITQAWRMGALPDKAQWAG